MTWHPTVERAAARFWSRVSKTDGCWLWCGALSPLGYGRFYVSASLWGRTYQSAHRVAYALTFGPPPSDMCVCHRCDNPRCVRPEHLFLGTTADNNLDKKLKGRAARMRGDLNGQAVLRSWQVDEIRQLLRDGRHSQRVIARKYGVSQPLISMIGRGIVRAAQGA